MTTIDYHIIGAKIRELRLERNMTQAALAEAADLSIPYLSHIERAMKKPSLKSLVQISNDLGVTLDCVLTGNQVADTKSFYPEVQKLLDDCSLYERCVILEVSNAVKRSLRIHRAA